MMNGDLDSLVLEELRGLKGDVAKLNAKLDCMKVGLASLRADVASELRAVRADIASDMLRMERDTRDQIVGLRRAIDEYHSTVIGHGMLINKLEARMRRVERHLNLPSIDSQREDCLKRTL
jgi:hypothetical protein